MAKTINPKEVIKKDGRKETFIKEKIVVSAAKAGAPVDVAREIADKIEKIPKEEIKTKEIYKLVLAELRSRNSEWPKRWLNYDKGVKRLYKYQD